MAKCTEIRSFWGSRGMRGFLPFTLLLLLIEFFDELHYGVQSAALPSLRADLGMTYAQAGLLLGLPVMTSALVEPALMLLGDTRLRKTLIVGGGLTVMAATLALSHAGSFPAALIAFVIYFPASGAFVTLSQATLADRNPGREAQMMARWTVFGSAGNLLGPIMLSALYAVGLTWRNAYWMLAALGMTLVISIIPHRFGVGTHQPATASHPDAPRPSRDPNLLRTFWQAVRTPGLLRWFILLDFSDLLLDVYLSYAALYFSDVIGLSPGSLGLMMGTLMAAGLLANLALIPILERIPGRRLVRASAWIAAGLYAAWLLAPWTWAKITLAVLLRLSTIGWYEVLQGEAFAALPGRSGTVMAISSIMGLAGAGLVWLVGVAAEGFGLPSAMWLLMAGPLALIWQVPREKSVVKLE